jgi:CDGSH-type Zn-finger protein/uncharacterized Fe-S cluster protein YjdI
MAELRRYEGQDVDISYEVKRCIHAAECVTRLSTVFDNKKRPWIDANGAAADATAGTIAQCPTGALHFERKDGGASEAPEAVNTVRVVENGPLYLRGDLEISATEYVEGREDTRMALCRCGESDNKPFCDNVHLKSQFTAGDRLADNISGSATDAVDGGRLAVIPEHHGPLVLIGNFTLVSVDGQTVYRGNDTALCRCGHSSNKPFCDGTHEKVNFQGE